MNGFTFISLIVLVYCIYEFAFELINIMALSKSAEQGKRNALEDRAMRMRLEKNGEWDATNDWK